MQKLFIIYLVFFSVFSFSQEKKNTNKNVDKNVTQKMDSLSKIYKVKVVGAYAITHNGVFVRGYVYEDKITGNLIQRETYRKDTN
jgi:predicted lipoprotein